MAKGHFEHFNEVKERFPSADLAKSADGDTLAIFNIGGNKYRLVAYISYKAQRVYIRKVMTHEEYDLWNKQGRPT